MRRSTYLLLLAFSRLHWHIRDTVPTASMLVFSPADRT